MTFAQRKYPYKKLYLDDKLVSEYYDPENEKNYGIVELRNNFLNINGYFHFGHAWFSVVFNDDGTETQIIKFITGDRLPSDDVQAADND